MPETQIKATTESSKPILSSGVSLVLGSLASSILICSYVIAIGMINLPKSDVDPLGRAAEVAAQELSNVTIEHPVFGRVGLCDTQEGEGADATRTTGANTLMARLRHAAIVAGLIDNASLLRLANQDIDAMRRLKIDLKTKLEQAIGANEKQDSQGEGAQTLYARVYKVLEGAYRNELKLVEVKIILGRINSQTASRTKIQAPLSERNTSFVEDGFYRAYARVPVPGSSEPIIFYPEGDGITPIAEAEFNPVELTTTPSAVLVEAVYEPKDTTKEKKTKTKSACALVGQKAPPPYPTALAFRFPDCIPPQFKTPSDVLSFTAWKGTGNWQQAAGGSVPGDGHLGPALNPVLSMDAGKAIELTVYQWLRQLDASTDPEKIAALLKHPFSEAERIASSRNSNFDSNINANSCLVQDTGAREFAILNQTAAGELGQEALARSLSIGSKRSAPPPSSIPLFIDGAGNCNLCGRVGFDKRLVEDFLEAVYDTNLAAIESRSIANQIQARSARVQHQLEQRLFVKKQELKSVDEAIKRLTPETKPEDKASAEALDIKLLPFVDKRKLLFEIVERDQKQREQLIAVGRLARQASRTAEQIAVTTFDLCTRANATMREGLFRVSPTERRQGNLLFLIGTRTVFAPYSRPVLESEFYDAVSQEARSDTSSSAETSRSPWLRKDFSVVANIETMFPDTSHLTVEGKNLSVALSETDVLPKASRATIVLDSRLALGSTKRTRLLDFEGYPFIDMPLPEGKLIYYSKSALKTGSAPVVSWSVLIRNMVNIRDSRAQRAQPVSLSEWCKQSEPGGCPDLAAEIQIRTPLPAIKDMPPGAIVSNPISGLRAQQIPPLPPEML